MRTASIFPGMFERRERSEKQDEFWVKADQLPAAAPSAFYRKLNATLDKMDFARQVWAICEPGLKVLRRRYTSRLSDLCVRVIYQSESI